MGVAEFFAIGQRVFVEPATGFAEIDRAVHAFGVAGHFRGAF